MSLFESSSYQQFLKDHIRSLPRAGRGEVNRIAQHLGVHASFVSQVLGGSKELNAEQAHALTKYLGLNALETDYFLLLVQSARAGSHDLRTYFRGKLSELKGQSLDVSRRIHQDHQLTDTEKAVFYSSWLYLAAWLFTSIEGGKTLEEVAELFEISRVRAREILDFLVGIRLCKLEGQKYKMGPQRIHLEQGSPFLSRHHMNWRVKALQRSENIRPEELMFTSPISISSEDFRFLRERLIKLIQETSERVAKSEPETLACLNLDLFLLAHKSHTT